MSVPGAALLGGRYWRLSGPNGPVHVWVPGSGGRSAVVAYAHGLGPGIDQVWRDQHLPEQFKQSGQDATFIAVEAPRAKGDPVSWSALEPLLAAVRDGAGLPVTGPVTAVAHSNGYTTVARWLTHPRLARVVLLDALYGSVAAFEAYAKAPGHKLDLIVTPGNAPERNANALAARLPGVVHLSELPVALDPAAARAPITVIRTGQSHAALSRGTAIATLLAAATASGGASGTTGGGSGRRVAIGAVILGVLFLVARRR